MNLKLKASLPADDLTGITNIDGLVTAICLLEPCRMVTDLDTGEIAYVLRVDRIEQVHGPDAKRLHDLMARYHADRTGKVPLNLEGAA